MPRKTPKTPYEILGVKIDATQEDIKKAWRSLVKTAHPDRGGKADGFSAIQKAYELLSDPKKRKVYDNLNGIVNQPKPVQDDDSYWNIGSFAKAFAIPQSAVNSYVAQAIYGASTGQPSPKTPSANRQYILIPRGLTQKVDISIYPSYNQFGAAQVHQIEATILMRNIPAFIPGDVLGLEFDYSGRAGTIEVRVEEVKYSQAKLGGEVYADVRGVQI